MSNINPMFCLSFPICVRAKKYSRPPVVMAQNEVANVLGHMQGLHLLMAKLLYGSGLRMTPDGGAPNSGHLPAYFTVNAALTHTWKNTPVGKVEGRLALINLFDKSYLLRDGSGVGVGAPQYGARRSVYAGLSTSF